MFNLPMIFKHAVAIILLDIVTHYFLHLYGLGFHLLMNTYLIVFCYGFFVFLWGFVSLGWTSWEYRYHFHFGFSLFISGILGCRIPVEILPSIFLWASLFVCFYLLSAFLFPKIFVFIDNVSDKWEFIPSKRSTFGGFFVGVAGIFAIFTEFLSNLFYLSVIISFIGFLLFISSYTLKRENVYPYSHRHF